MVRVIHPDGVTVADKSTANESFNISHQAYLVTSDVEKRAQHDATPDLLFAVATVAARWQYSVRSANGRDINETREKHQKSENEKKGIIREYKIGEGCMFHMLSNLPFERYEDEPRVSTIINELVKESLFDEMKNRIIPK